MEITSRSPVILRKQLRKCIELLGNEYNSLPYSIYVYKDRSEVEAERKLNPDMPDSDYDYILNNREYVPPGICVHEQKRIKLFPFNQKESEYPAVDTVAFAYHEIRHAWQYMNGLYLDEVDSKLEAGGISDYLQLPSEKDAYQFMENQMNVNVEAICQILELPAGKRYIYRCDMDSILQKMKRVVE